MPSTTLSSEIRMGIAFLLVALLGLPLTALAQQTETQSTEAQPTDPEIVPPRGEMIRTMGFPSRWDPYVGALVDWNRQPDTKSVGGTAHVGVHWSLTDPVVNIFGLNAEAYLGGIDSEVDAGGRLTGSIPFLALRLGVDYSTRSEELDFILTVGWHLRRGGVFGGGSRLRIDWLPARNNSFNFGFEVPLSPWAGKTRPKSDHVNLPKPPKSPEQPFTPSAELVQTLHHVDHAAEWINRYTTVYTDQDGKSHEDEVTAFSQYVDSLRTHITSTDSLFLQGHTFNAEVAVYHQQLSRAFELALAGAPDPGSHRQRAEIISARAKHILFAEVLAPYNRLLAQVRGRDSLLGLGASATGQFSDWAQSSASVPPQALVPVRYVFASLLDTWERCRQQSRDDWKESRLVWLPIRWVYEQDEIDSQAELDAVIAEVIGKPFTHGNRMTWVKNEMFQGIVGQMIRDAEDYHVLWIHDFRGLNDDGNPDAIAYVQTTRSYLSALIDRVQQYDTTGKMPTYLVFLDEWYYAANKSIFWAELLADPLHHQIKLPADNEKWQQELDSLQEQLRTAVSGSAGLQAGLELYGPKWLNNLVKVHFYITNPADYSFRSKHIISLPFIPDMMMRDHRKISFCDVTELDPSRGSGIYTGMGVGEHYTGPTWDDRGILVQGPALVDLKTAAHDLLLSQGFKPDEVPRPLRPLLFPVDYEDQVAALIDKGWHARGLQVQNSTGFAPKQATVMKTLIYDLMPPGAHLYVPDSLWSNSLWGGMMIGAALRGCTVLVVAPSVQNAPSAAVPTMARGHRVMVRLFVAQQQLADVMHAAQGNLHVGIYNTDLDVDDIAGQVGALAASFKRNEFLRQEFPFTPSTLDSNSVAEFFQSIGLDITHLPGGLAGQKPKLHLKSQLFRILPTEVWNDLFTSTQGLYAQYMVVRSQQVDDPWTVDPWSDFTLDTDLRSALRDWIKKLTDEQREHLAMYLTEGSQNQDYRSMVSDGEALMVAAGNAALIALYDFVYIMGITTWVDSGEDLDSMLPEQSGFGTWLGGLLKDSI